MTFLDDTEEKSQQCKHHGDDRAGDRQPKAPAQRFTGEGEGENDSKRGCTFFCVNGFS
jgi:hypothetical protein